MVKIYTALNKEYRLPKASEIELLAPFKDFASKIDNQYRQKIIPP